MSPPALSSPPRSPWRRLQWVAALVGLGLAVFFLVLPGVVERFENPVLRPPPYPVGKEAQDLHDRLLVADLHADTLLWHRSLLERGSRGQVDLPRLWDGNVALQVFTTVTQIPAGMNLVQNSSHGGDPIALLALAQRWPVATWSSPLARALFQAERLRQAAAGSQGRLMLVRSRGELETLRVLHERGHVLVGGVLGVEGVHCLEGRVENLERLDQAGFRVLGLAHFFDNEMAGSAHGEARGGLTPEGIRLLAEAESRGMLVDLAHASEQTIEDVLARATRPVVVSHTGLKGVCDNPRNLRDGQAREIAAAGGLIGIGYWKTAVCGSDVAAIARSIRYAVDLVGVEHVALGSDFDGGVTTPFDVSGLPLLTQALLEQGFQDFEVAAIMGGNLFRLLAQVLPR